MKEYGLTGFGIGAFSQSLVLGFVAELAIQLDAMREKQGQPIALEPRVLRRFFTNNLSSKRQIHGLH